MNRALMGFIKKELTQSLRDPRMKFLLFFTPMIQLTLFGVAVSNEVKNIRLAAIFDSRDYLTRDIYERAIAGKWFVPADVRGEHDPYKMIQAGMADAVLVPPPGGFARNLGRGNAPMQVLADATNVLQAQSVEGYLRSIVQDAVRADEQISPPETPIQLDMRVLYNPSLETAIFMVPGTMCMLIVMTTMMLSMAAIVREKEAGTFETLISAPVSPAEVIFGKTIPYVVLGMLNFPLVLAVAVFVFHVPMRGSLAVLCLAAFVFICTCVALGTLISTFCQNQQQSALASFLFMFPAMMFSGIMFPLENMPAAIKWVAYLDPLAHYLGLLRNILLKGGGAGYVALHIGILAFMAVIFILISFRRFRTTLQ
jgi:ABC-2 type transport system permease protein